MRMTQTQGAKNLRFLAVGGGFGDLTELFLLEQMKGHFGKLLVGDVEPELTAETVPGAFLKRIPMHLAQHLVQVLQWYRGGGGPGEELFAKGL